MKMKTPKIVLLGALLLLAVAITDRAWESYWKTRWIDAAQVEDDAGAAQ